MNRVFKTKWSVAHQEYVVTDEQHTTKGKAAKSAVALAVAALMLAAGSASAAFQDPSFFATGFHDVLLAQKSFETAEYKKDWGLEAMHASKAYALGFTGKGVAVGVMDSGALLQKHPQLSGDRFSVSSAKGEYGSTGNRYPQAVDSDGKGGLPYEKGEKFDIDGNWKEGVNDSHGTHVTGTVGANRDGEEFHGVAWGSDIIVGNTGATDDNNYGPFQDYEYFKKAWTGLADKIVEANKERGGVINNSWGTNTRVEGKTSVGHDGYNTSVHLDVNTVAETDYEFKLFAKRYGGFDSQEKGITDNKSFVYAAYEAVKDKNIVQIMTTGNRDMKNPYYRALYPLYNPAAEKHWIAVAGLKQGAAEGTYELVKNFNEAGQGKWWTVAAPGNAIYSSTTGDHGEPGYASWGGTSMAAPHVAGAMGVLMSRYDQMNALQVRDVMFTTANHKNADGSNMEGWTDVDGTVRGDGEVSDRMGWGVPDLDKGMYGPGQFLGKFEYDMAKNSKDVWTNDITNAALDQRKAEDEKWLASVTDEKGNIKLPYDKRVDGSDFVVKDGDANKTDDEKKSHITSEAEEKALLAAYQNRVQAIKDRQANGDYEGSLVKKGEGTLVMTGNNSYKGTTTVEGGRLLAFAESIGVDNTVTVKNGGTFGVLSAYDDTFTKKGHLTSKEATKGELKINIEKGGSLYVDAGSRVVVDTVDFNDKNDKKVVVGLAGADRDALMAAYKGQRDGVSGSFEALNSKDVFDGINKTVEAADSAFFELGNVDGKGGNINVTMTRKEGVTFGTFAHGANQQSIAQAIEASSNGLTADLLAKDKATIEAVYAGLDDDFYITARNAMIENATQVTRLVTDQAQGIGQGRMAEFDEGRAHIWATGMGLWGSADGNKGSLDNDFTVGMFGAEFNVAETTKLGAFFGVGSTKISGDQGSIKGDDKHYGVYGLTDFDNLSFTYGIAYTDQNRDTTRWFAGTPNGHSEQASVLQGFAEAGYNFEVAAAKVTPYAGLTWMRVETDDVKDAAVGHEFKTEGSKDDIQVATLGVRTSLPFNWGTLPVAVKADAGWSHFFGDTDGTAKVQMGANGQFATIEGSDIKDQFNLGLGLVGQVGKNATVGVNYVGAWGSDIDTHGITANVRINF